jgi:autotransporter-associated beta strand protein
VGGTGVLTFTNNNTYTGATNINSGATLQLGSGGTTGWVGSTSGISNNGTLVYNRSNNVSTSLVISGTGALTKNGTGTLTISGANSYTGATTINAGTLELGANNVIGDSSAVTMTGGGLDLGANAETLHSLNMSGGTLSRGGATLTLSNASSITGGNVTLSAASSRIDTAGALTLGSATINYPSGSGNNNAIVLGGNVAVNASTTANILNGGGGAVRLNLNNANTS